MTPREAQFRELIRAAFTGDHLGDAVAMMKRLAGLKLLGFKCRVYPEGLVRLIRTPPIGPVLMETAFLILEGTDEATRYDPLKDLESIRRGVLAHCFPDAPQTSGVEPPDWLTASPIEGERQAMLPRHPPPPKTGRRQRQWAR